MFNSIESRARHGLTPTHVPAHGETHGHDVDPAHDHHGTHGDQAMSGTEQSTSEQGVTITPMYKKILHQSQDYQQWLRLKNDFLREQGTAGDKNNDKFPNFPDDADTNNIDDPRHQREIGHSRTPPPVFKEGGTLYRSRTPLPRRKPHQKEEQKRQPEVKVSSLPVTTPAPAPTYSSPLYPNTPFYSTPQPPLPPGYELIPVDQLTDDHEVVPWEQLPQLMKKHNMSLDTIPLGPFHHSTTPSPVKIFSSAPRVPYTKSTPSPRPVTTTKKPFTVFSPISNPLPPVKSPYIPPPVSPELSDSLYYGQVHPKHHQHPSTPSKPKSIHFGTHFGPVHNSIHEESTTAKPDVVSNTFRYNPTTVPAYDHTPSLGHHQPTPAPIHDHGHSPSPVPSHGHSPTPPPTFPTLGRYSPFPQHFTTAATPHFESTRLPPVHSNHVSSIGGHHQDHVLHTSHVSSTVTPKYYPTSSLHTTTLHQFPTTTPTTIFHHPSTTPTTIYHQPTPPSSVASMPKYLPPPNQQHPTYFDVAKPVHPEPPPVVHLKPVADHGAVFTPTSSTPIRLQGKLKSPVNNDNGGVSVVLPVNSEHRPFEHFTVKSGASPLAGLSADHNEASKDMAHVTTPAPDNVTKNNPNKMRSSTYKNTDIKQKKFR